MTSCCIFLNTKENNIFIAGVCESGCQCLDIVFIEYTLKVFTLENVSQYFAIFLGFTV